MSLCECGCGLDAPVARKTDRRFGHVRGEPVRFRRGHGARKHPHPNGTAGVRVCVCHGEPMEPAGEKWRCSVKQRENRDRYDASEKGHSAIRRYIMRRTIRRRAKRLGDTVG